MAISAATYNSMINKPFFSTKDIPHGTYAVQIVDFHEAMSKDNKPYVYAELPDRNIFVARDTFQAMKNNGLGPDTKGNIMMTVMQYTPSWANESRDGIFFHKANQTPNPKQTELTWTPIETPAATPADDDTPPF